MKILSAGEITSGYAVLKAKMELVGPLSDTTWQYLRTHSQPRFYKKKTTLLREGQRPITTGFIIQGAAKGYYTFPQDGCRVITRLYVPYEACGPENLHLGEPYTENIEFVNDSWLIEISCEAMMYAQDNFLDFTRIYIVLLEQYNRVQQEKIRDFQMLTVSQRLENLMATNALYFNYFSIADIASYLGTKRETLTRMRSKLYK